ncbi:MAG: hypothetical protein GY835_11590, partial [bacterium]|nr:hypothetical protein [bacterium]
MLEQAEIEVASGPWETSPAPRQEPTLNPWYGTGDVAPGTLLQSGEMPLGVRVTPGPAGANGSSEELVTTFEYETETNQPELIVDPLGAETVIERNDLGLAERTTRAAGADEAGTTEYSYNA